MRSEICSAKMGHAVQASKGGASTLAVMRVELLFGEDISTSLQCGRPVSKFSDGGCFDPTSQEKETIGVME